MYAFVSGNRYKYISLLIILIFNKKSHKGHTSLFFKIRLTITHCVINKDKKDNILNFTSKDISLFYVIFYLIKFEVKGTFI